MAEEQQRNRYTKDSRTTLWRRKQESDDEECTCEFHSNVILEQSEQCSSDSLVTSVSTMDVPISDLLLSCTYGEPPNDNTYLAPDGSQAAAEPDLNSSSSASMQHFLETDRSTTQKQSKPSECYQGAHISSENQVGSKSSLGLSEISSAACAGVQILAMEHEDDIDIRSNWSDGDPSSSSPASSTSSESSNSSNDHSSDGSDGGDPDEDPDNPDEEPGNPDENPIIPDDNSDDDENFSLDHASLDRLHRAAENRTDREILALILAHAVRHNLNYETIIGFCRIVNLMSEDSNLPFTKKQLWSRLKKNSAGVRKHAYCPACSEYLGLIRNVGRAVLCLCGIRTRKKHLKTFITLSITKQLRRLLSIPGIWEQLQYRNNRQKINENALEDIFDGSGYEALRDQENGLREPYDFSFIMNTDGFSLSKSSNTEAWPIFLKLNELPPSMRQRTAMLAGLMISESQPDFNLFLRAFVVEANQLSTVGIPWQPENHDDVMVSRFYPTCFCLDAKARAGVLNSTLYSGECGCTFCEHPGIYLEGSMRYPLPGTEVRRQRGNAIEVVIIPHDIPQRTDESIRADMMDATEEARVNGLKGPSVIMLMENFNLGYGFSTDDLHPVYIGVTKFLTELIIRDAGNVGVLIRAIDRRLLQIRSPTHLSRKPRSISKRGKWKGSEWRNWLLYFGVPCLKDLVPNARVNHFALLSKAIFLLSRDSVTQDNIVVAHQCLQRFVTMFQERYGPEKMRFNVHVLLHVSEAVRRWGPLQLHSTCPFETLNWHYKNFINSPFGADDQIVDHHLLRSLVQLFSCRPDLNEDVKEEIESLLSRKNAVYPVKVGGAYVPRIGENRIPTEEEMQLLVNRGFHCNRLTEYKQCLKSNMLCHSVRYNQEEDSKSDNTIVYTLEDQFCVIDDVVTFGEGDDSVCGIFCHVIQVDGALNGASHIMGVDNANGRDFVPIGLVRNVVVKMKIDDSLYVSPMANNGEID